MKKTSVTTGPQYFRALKHRFANRVLPALVLTAAGLLAGCQSGFEDESAPTATQPTVAQPATGQPAALAAKPAEVITLREGDVVKVSFPSSPTLDTTQQIGATGKSPCRWWARWTRPG